MVMFTFDYSTFDCQVIYINITKCDKNKYVTKYYLRFTNIL